MACGTDEVEIVAPRPRHCLPVHSRSDMSPRIPQPVGYIIVTRLRDGVQSGTCVRTKGFSEASVQPSCPSDIRTLSPQILHIEKGTSGVRFPFVLFTFGE